MKTKPNKTGDEIERRFLRVSDIELRAAGGDGEGMPTIIGYAAVFDKLSEDLGGWWEKIAPGAFANSIKVDDIRALVDHNSSMILGRNKAETLSLKEDDRGLFVEIIPPDTQVGRDIITSIDRGDVDSMSFSFKTINDGWEVIDEKDVRTLKEVKLFDTSPVTFPAYLDTEVGLRNLAIGSRSLEVHRETLEKEKPSGGVERMKMEVELAEADA